MGTESRVAAGSLTTQRVRVASRVTQRDVCHPMDDELDELPADPGASRRLNVLYLVAELEAAIELGGIALTADDAALPARVANVASALRRQIEEG
jgi:hypothetical protein